MTSEYFKDFTNEPPPSFGVPPVHFANKVGEEDMEHITDVFDKSKYKSDTIWNMIGEGLYDIKPSRKALERTFSEEEEVKLKK